MRLSSLVALVCGACGSASPLPPDGGATPDSPAGQVTIDAPAASDAAGTPDAASVDAAPGSDAAGTPDAPSGIVVTGSVIDHYIDDDGETSVPINLVAREVVVLVPEGVGYSLVAGSGTAGGSFSIAGVGNTQRMVGVGRTYVVTQSLALDLGSDVLGRTDRREPAVRQSGFSVSLDNLDGAAPTDYINYYSSNLPIYGAHELGDGVTTLARTYRPNFLIEAAKGDRVWITQLATRLSENQVSYRGLTRAYSPTPFTTSDGQILGLPAGSMVAVAPATTLDLDWRRSELHALRGSVHPLAEVTRHSLFIVALPGRPKVTDADTADLFASLLSSEGDDVDFGKVSFGNPFPAAWEVLADVRSSYRVRLSAQQATTPADIIAAVYDSRPAAQLDGVPIRPAVTPPRDPRIAGKDGFATQLGVGALPLLSWTAPAIGTPDVYHVAIVELVNDNGATVTVNTLNVYTPNTSVRIPPSRLAAGHMYFARIRAVVAPGADFAVSPLRGRLPDASAEVVTSPFTP